MLSTVTRKFWKESASVIIIGKNSGHKKEPSNYKVLVMKRSKNASHLPSTIVFPGGVIEKVDSAEDWKLLYNELGISNDKLKEVTLINGDRPEIFQTPTDEQLDRNITLRITAIRETFEELGILICKTQAEFQQSNQLYAKIYNKFNIKHWQNEVHRDASKFLILCQTLKVAPDLWCTYEWGSWLSLANLRPRFNTAFYLISLENQPEVLAESNEVQEYMWETPEILHKLNEIEEVFVTAPQLYELARLNGIDNIDLLTKFAKTRNRKGCTSFFFVMYETFDGVIVVLPGDDLYPKYVDPTQKANDTEKYKDKTSKELRDMVLNLHRIEYTSWNLHSIQIIINIQPFNDHINPVKFKDSKL